MDLDTDPDRWAGLLVAAGVLLSMALWFVARYSGKRVRAVVHVLAAAYLVYATAIALSRTSIIGYLFGYQDFPTRRGDAPDLPTLVVLLAVGTVTGLAIAILLRPAADGPDAAYYDEDDELGEDDDLDELDDLDDGFDDDGDDEAEDVEAAPAEPTVPAPISGRTEVIGEEPADAHWSTNVIDREPRAFPLPMRGATVALLLVALALALPLPQPGFAFSNDYDLLRISDIDAWDAASMIASGYATGLALLFAALLLRARDLPVVALAFGAVAAGQGFATAYPDTIGHDEWLMVGVGLVAGLLLPTVLRLVRRVDTRDAVATGIALLLAIATVAGASALEARATRIDFGSSVGNDDDEDDEDVSFDPSPFPEPTFSFPVDFPTEFPTDFPTELLTDFPIESMTP